jgi:hypothetical protein
LPDSDLIQVDGPELAASSFISFGFLYVITDDDASWSTVAQFTVARSASGRNRHPPLSQWLPGDVIQLEPRVPRDHHPIGALPHPAPHKAAHTRRNQAPIRSVEIY